MDKILKVNKKLKKYKNFVFIWKNFRIFLRNHLIDNLLTGKELKIAVAISGGKDSLVLFFLLKQLQYTFDNLKLVPVMVDVGSKASGNIKDYEEYFNLEFNDKLIVLEKRNIYKLAIESDKFNPCYPCSTLRRKALFDFCKENNIHYLALGHHRDDVIHTLFLNMVFSSTISTILPIQTLFDGDLNLIRPLYYVWEDDIILFTKSIGFKVFDKSCDYSSNAMRDYIKDAVNYLTRKDKKQLKMNIFNSLSQVKIDYVLGTVKEK